MQGSSGDADIKNRLVDTVGKAVQFSSVRVGQIERVTLEHVHYHI